MTVSVPRFCSSAGDSVPQKGQTSASLDGFQLASAPHAGQLYFSRAVATPAASMERLGSATSCLSACEHPASRSGDYHDAWADARAYCMKAASAARVMRHWLPIFLPLRSPESRLAIT